ncbi:MAG: formylmethanofuran dehydrogenase subunit B [Candidatus Thorarchaeota archaeon]
MANAQILENVVCPFCGCLCDDLRLTIENDVIVQCERGCALGKAKFLHYREDRMLSPTLRQDSSQVVVPLETAIDHAARILVEARRPLIYGLSSTENDAHREAYRLAEYIGAVVDNTSSVCHGPSIIGTQASGEPMASLAEVRNRADLVIYWGANPLYAHPRHVNRFVRAPGEYIKDPKAERQMWVVDVRESVTSRIADRSLIITPGSDLEVIGTLRALARGHTVDVSSVGGVSLDTLRELADIMKQAKYGVLFYGLGLTQSRGRHNNIDATIRLVQDLNSFTKWSMLPMRGHYNVTGANKTSTWTTGYPYAVDYSRGYPRYQPGEYTAVDLLRRREVDALLNIAADPAAHFPRDAIRGLKSIPIINLDPKRNLTSLIASVNIPTAIAGIECDGAVARMDGLPLYLKKIVEPPEEILPDREVLRMIFDRVKEVSDN